MGFAPIRPLRPQTPVAGLSASRRPDRHLVEPRGCVPTGFGTRRGYRLYWRNFTDRAPNATGRLQTTGATQGLRTRLRLKFRIMGFGWPLPFGWFGRSRSRPVEKRRYLRAARRRRSVNQELRESPPRRMADIRTGFAENAMRRYKWILSGVPTSGPMFTRAVCSVSFRPIPPIGRNGQAAIYTTWRCRRPWAAYVLHRMPSMEGDHPIWGERGGPVGARPDPCKSAASWFTAAPHWGLALTMAPHIMV